MLTTAGFTIFAISTKFFASPPPIGGCGAVATGRMIGAGTGSGPALPVGNQPMLDAITTPMTIPPVTNVNGTSHARTSFIGDSCCSSLVAHTIYSYHTQTACSNALEDLARVNPHDCIEEFQRLRFRSLERVSPNDGAEPPSVTNGTSLLKDIRVLTLGPSGEDNNPAPIERTLHHISNPFRQCGNRNLGRFIDLL